jgi:GR25 family glycosyltransferase involved in LPS biosynthesis
MSGIEYVVINLEERTDRLASFQSQFTDSKINPIRIEAVSGKNIKGLNYVKPNVAACWQSHLKAYAHLQKTDASHLVIFEDDAILTPEGRQFLANIDEEKLAGIDLLQFGYLTHKKKIDLPRYDRVLVPFLYADQYLGEHLSKVDLIFRIWITTTRFIIRKFPSKLSFGRSYLHYFKNEVKLRRKIGSKYPLIYHSFEPGTHAYIISREYSMFLRKTNLPTFLAADLHLMGVAASGNSRTIRISKSLCNQSKSPSSINEKDMKFESLKP